MKIADEMKNKIILTDLAIQSVHLFLRQNGITNSDKIETSLNLDNQQNLSINISIPNKGLALNDIQIMNHGWHYVH